MRGCSASAPPPPAWLIPSLVCLSLLTTVEPARATSLRRMDLPEVVAVADRIVHARVVQNRTYWSPAGQVLTDTVFDVVSDVKGSGAKTLTITQLGGRIGGIEVSVEGTPAFAVGEEVVLLSELTRGGTRVVVGLSQGLMRIHVDPQTGEKTAVSEAIPESVTVVGGRSQRAAARLETLLEDLRRMSAAGGGKP